MSWNNWNNDDERSVLEQWKSCYQYEINELNKNPKNNTTVLNIKNFFIVCLFLYN